jgi:hypothetical protein
MSNTAFLFMFICPYFTIGILSVLVYYRIFHKKDIVDAVDVIMQILCWPFIALFLFVWKFFSILGQWFEAITGKKFSGEERG